MGETAYHIWQGPRNTVLGRCLVLFKHFKSSSSRVLLFYVIRDLLNKMAYVAPHQPASTIRFRLPSIFIRRAEKGDNEFVIDLHPFIYAGSFDQWHIKRAADRSDTVLPSRCRV
jgi:hypothetical protein